MRKKRLLMLALLLLMWGVGGAIVNIAVAWSCTLRWRSLELSHYGGNLEAESTDAEWLKKYNWPPPDANTFIAHHGLSTFGWIEDRYTISFKPYDPSTTAGLWRTRSGWPLLSVQGISQSGSNKELGDLQVGWFYIDGELIGRPEAGWHFPVLPLTIGFAINTVFYSVILWLLFAAPFALRRRRRIRRGLCPKCAYPTWGGGKSDVCTECGAALRTKAVSA